MYIQIISISNKVPGWVEQGFLEYAKRFPKELKLKLIEIPPIRRTKNTDILRIKKLEGEMLLSHCDPLALTVALDVTGKTWSTEQLADRLQKWMDDAISLNLLIGGADGLSAECLRKSPLTWSLSPLTFPHALVRILVAEQLYRAWTILTHHPYHRG